MCSQWLQLVLWVWEISVSPVSPSPWRMEVCYTSVEHLHSWFMILTTLSFTHTLHLHRVAVVSDSGWGVGWGVAGGCAAGRALLCRPLHQETAPGRQD